MVVVLIKNEFYKLLKSKRYYAFIGIILVLILAFSLAIKSILNSSDVSQSVIDTIKVSEFPLQVLGTMSDFLLPVFVTLMITFFISDEFIAATFKLPLLHGFKRSEVIIAKVITTIIAICFILVIEFFFSYGVSFLMWGKEVFNTPIIIETIRCYVLQLLPLIPFMFIVISIALLLKNSGLVIGIIAALLVGSTIIGTLIPQMNKYLITYYLKAFAGSLDKLDVKLGVIVCILYGLIFILLSNEIVKRIEVNR